VLKQQRKTPLLQQQPPSRFITASTVHVYHGILIKWCAHYLYNLQGRVLPAIMVFPVLKELDNTWIYY